MQFPQLERITIDPRVMGGKPCIRGIRITVGAITVFTKDLDFGALLYLTDALAPSVVQIRAEHIVPWVMGAAVLEALATAELLLNAGALVTIDPRRHRVRALPLRGSTDV